MRWLLIVGLMPVVASWPFFLQPEPSSTPKSMLSFENCVDVDLLQIEELRNLLGSRIRLQDTNQKSKISFGLLDEDWQRLHLLESRVPNNSLLKTKLVRAFRLLITALYQAHGPTDDNIYNGTNANGSSNYDSVLLRPGIYPNLNQSGLEKYDKNKENDHEAAESDQMESNLPPPITTATYEQPGPTSIEDGDKPKETHRKINNDEPDKGQLSNGAEVEPNNLLSERENFTASGNGSKKDSNSDTKGEPGETQTQIEDVPDRGDISSYNSTAHNTDDYGKPVPSNRYDQLNKAPVSETNTENDGISKQTSLKSFDYFNPTDPSETNLDYENVPVLPIDNSEEILHPLKNISGDDMPTKHSDLSIESSTITDRGLYNENQPPENYTPDKINTESRYPDNNYVPVPDSNNTLDDSQPPYDTEMGPDEIIFTSTPENTMTSKESSTANLLTIPPDPLVTSKQWSASEIGYDNPFSSSSSPTENDLTTTVFYTTTANTVKYNVDDSPTEFKDVTIEIFTTTDRDISTVSLTDTPKSLYGTQNVNKLGYESSSKYPEITTSIPVNTLKLSENPQNEESLEPKDSDIEIPSDGSTYDSTFERTTITVFPWKSETEDNTSTFPNYPTFNEKSITTEPTTVSNLNQLPTDLDGDDKDIFPESKEIPDKEQYTFPITDYKAPTTTTTVQPTKESFKTFSIVFAKENENSVPIIPNNRLNIYLPNRRPFKLGLRGESNNCKHNNNCIRVRDIEFKDSEDRADVINRLQGSRGRISEFNKIVHPELSDSENDYWRFKMNSLRRKSINR